MLDFDQAFTVIYTASSGRLTFLCDLLKYTLPLPDIWLRAGIYWYIYAGTSVASHRYCIQLPLSWFILLRYISCYFPMFPFASASINPSRRSSFLFIYAATSGCLILLRHSLTPLIVHHSWSYTLLLSDVSFLSGIHPSLPTVIIPGHICWYFRTSHRALASDHRSPRAWLLVIDPASSRPFEFALPSAHRSHPSWFLIVDATTSLTSHFAPPST